MAHCTKPTISLIVPVHLGGEDFDRCLRSVAKATPPPDEVIVVVDGSDDAARQQADQFGAQVAQTTIRAGPAQARNVGARMAHGEVLCFVDADVLIPTDAFGLIAAAFRNDPELSAVFGSYDEAPDAANFISQYKNLLHHYVHQTSREQASTFWAGCGAVRRDIFLDLGGFDERYRQPTIEDIELGYRLRSAGYRIKLCKSLQVKHLKRWTALSLLRSDFFQRALPWTELILSRRTFVNDLNLQQESRLSVMLVYALVGALAGSPRWPPLLLAAAVLALALLGLNAPVYRFFLRKRGLWFALRTIPWHWCYYLYSGLAFLIGVARHVLGTSRVPSTRLQARDRAPSGPGGGPASL